MPGLVKIWWHDGATRDIRYHDIPVVNEPELGFETLTVNAAPANTGAAPEDATVAVVETDVNVRYVVRPPGGSAVADPVLSKPIAATGPATNSIGVAPGYSISFIEA
ncbi:MAG: hypothetical protein AAF479_17565 [Pseudomonadota bacterium]